MASERILSKEEIETALNAIRRKNRSFYQPVR